MKTLKYSRKEAMSLIPLLEGIATEIKERRATISMLEQMIPSLAASLDLHAAEVSIRKVELHRERIELRRIGRELENLECRQILTEPFEIFIPGCNQGFTWRCGEKFLRACSMEPFAA